MTLLVAPKPQILQKVAQQKAQRERDRQAAIKQGLPPEPEPSAEIDEEDEEDEEDDEDDEG
jgi:translation initiation factor IF-3